MIYTRKFGIQRPAGLTFSPRAQALVVLEAENTAQSAEPQLKSMMVDLSEEPLCSRSFPYPVTGRLDAAVSGADESLLIRDSFGKRWIKASADCRDTTDASKGLVSAIETREIEAQSPGGMAYDPQSGDLFTFDADGRRIVRMFTGAQGDLDVTAAQKASRSPWIHLGSLGEVTPGALAINPQNGHLFVLGLAEKKLFELSETGAIVAVRDLSSVGLADPRGMVFAPSGDRTDDPATMNLYIADSGLNAKGSGQQGSGKIVELTLKAPVLAVETLAAATTETGNLVNTILAWKFIPPAPDTAGPEYVPGTDTLWIVDSEVDEMSIFKGVNVFESTRSGSLTRTHNTMAFTTEPTGIAYDTFSGHFFISSDSGDKYFEVKLGADGLMGTSDDVVTSLSAAAYGCGDPEGIAYDSANRVIYLGCGVDGEVVVIRPGPNGKFDGPPSSGDDQFTHFDTASLGVADLEGIGFDPDSGTLYLVGPKNKTTVFEVTTSGTLVRMINISAANAVLPAGVGFGPGSAGPGSKSMYVADRGIDNNNDSNENDGKVYEFALAATSSTAPSVNSFTPTSGLVGDAVTITGNNFTGATAVAFNGAGAAFTAVNNTQITTTVPNGATTGKISVTNGGVTGRSATDFTVVVAPTITTTSLPGGTVGVFYSQTLNATGGTGTYTWNIIAGSGSLPPGLSLALATGVISGTPSTGGSYPFTVQVTDSANPAQTDTQPHSITININAPLPTPPPMISSFSPTSGPVGTVVMISGSALTVVTQVLFNTTPATVFTVVGDTRIDATVPAGTTTGKISVTNPAGTGVSTADFTVTATIQVRVAASTDDAEQGATSTSLTSSDLELTVDGTFNQTVGLRFNNVTIPRAATILEAWVQFKVDEVSSTATTLMIQGEAADNAVTFASTAGNISSRPRTVAAVSWTPPGWNTVGEAGAAERTPNIGAVIQAVVNRSGWASGNSVVVIITGDGNGKRVA
ncbi:MAG TPA: putative Ig domain-containing protein, partial [Candidatus Acidoferrales bacterium]|nr:putative Ig domain-containing protein [Candidatus Acidoferrales bacterium]